MAGVPTGGIESAEKSMTGRGYGHTQYDTVDKVDLKRLREASAMAARLSMRIANESDWPVSQREEKAVLELLDGPEYQEEKAYRERLEEYYQQNRKA